MEKEEKPTVLWRPLYNMSKDEFLVLKKKLTEYLDKGFIRMNNLSIATPVFLVKKRDGSLRFYVNYRNFNRVTKTKKCR